MSAQRRFDQETRERAVRVHGDRRGSDPDESMIAARRHVGVLLGSSSETLRGWGEREEVNPGERTGAPDSESETVRVLRNENAEPRRANENLKVACAFFAKAGLDRRLL